MKLPKTLKKISLALNTQGAKAIIVGGAVRDYFLSLPIKDYDIEVYGLEDTQCLEKILQPFGSLNHVGKSFGVLKLNTEDHEYDFSLPRTEKQVGTGHRSFEVKCDSSMSFQKASRRRDFTINAMGYDIAQGSFLDPYHAQEDMARKLLRHIDAHTFVEDPLRVYRAVQFCARFEYTLDSHTFSLCQKMVTEGMLDTLPKERIFLEFKKLLLKAEKPSLGFTLMRELGILRYFPELEALIGVEQSPEYHPEGDVWIHTLMSLDAMATQRTGDDVYDLKMMFAILCHDLGKPSTTQCIEGKIRAIGHEEAGIEPTRILMYRLTDEHEFIEDVIRLIKHHLKPSLFYKDGAKSAAIRRLATQVNIEELVRVARADFMGRTTPEALSGNYEAGEWLLSQAKALHVEERPLPNLLQGRDLIALGMEPSPLFKEILNDVYEKLLEGELHNKEEALTYVRYNYT